MFKTLESPGPGVRVPLRALNMPFGGALTHRVTTQFHRQPDLTERGRLHDEIEFDWRANSGWLPHFHGTLRLRIEAAKTRLILQGDYVAPFGLLGIAFDRSIGRRLAQATAADLLDGLARELTDRWAVERRAG
jgi:hypothetical protein